MQSSLVSSLFSLLLSPSWFASKQHHGFEVSLVLNNLHSGSSLIITSGGSLDSEFHAPSHYNPDHPQRSQYSIRLYDWAKKDGSVLEEIRKVLGLDSVKDVDRKIIQEPPLTLWVNFRQRALDPVIGFSSH